MPPRAIRICGANGGSPCHRETLERLTQLGARCRHRDIDFGIGLTPFEIYLSYDDSARECLRAKVLQLNDTGAATLAILFDDMRGDVEGIAEMQARVIDEVCDLSTARRFIVCPTYYSYDARLTREFGAPPKSICMIWEDSSILASSASGLARKSSRTDTPPSISPRSPPTSDASPSSGIITSPTTRRAAPTISFWIPSAHSWSMATDGAAGLAVNPMNQPHLSRIPLRGYRHLLTMESDLREVLPDICRELCGPRVAQFLLEDLELLQKSGLNQLDGDRRGMLDRYEAEAGNPYAQEVAAFLRGEYVFDPQCLTD